LEANGGVLRIPGGVYWYIELPPTWNVPPRLLVQNRSPPWSCARAASGIAKSAVQTARRVTIVSRVFIVVSFRNCREEFFGGRVSLSMFFYGIRGTKFQEKS